MATARGAALGVALIGCGDVARRYCETLGRHPQLAWHGATDRHPPRVEALVADFGGSAYDSLDEVLADPDVDIVLNLTRQSSHLDVTRRCLEAGKHVFSEKPLALRAAEARELVGLAADRDVRLACAPTTYLGGPARAVFRLIREGAVGTPRVVYADGNWGRIERWHPRPTDFYEVGAAFDVGVYPITLLTALFGPARRVRAFGEVVLPQRRTVDGADFTVGTPDVSVALIELARGVLVRLTASFYVPSASVGQGIEIHGDAGSVHLASPLWFDAAVQHAPIGEPYSPVVYDGAMQGVDWARGPAELAAAILEDRPHRASGEHAAHVVEVLEAIATAMREERAVEVESTFVDA